MGLGDLVRVLWQDLKAYRRGDRRVAPRFDVNGRVVGGRVYEKRGSSPSGTLPARSRWKPKMSFRVYRDATDTWEDSVEVKSVEVR